MSFAATSADLCLWSFDRQCDRFWVTDHGRDMLGFGPHEILTRQSITTIVHPDDRGPTMSTMRAAASANKLADLEFRIVRPDGGIRWIRGRARAHTSDNSAPGQITGTFVDITDAKAAEQELALQRQEIAHLMRVSMLGELSGGIAHEITQPLSAIMSNAEAARILLMQPSPNINEAIETLDDIISEDARAGKVIHRLRALLRKSEAKFDPIDINEIASSALRLLHNELITRRVKINLELADGLPLALGDSVQLQQVLLNLALNAIDAMNAVVPSRRVITVKTSMHPEERIQVQVSDRGVGLSPSHQERLFQPFFTTKDRGLGLGLSLCSAIVKMHGGTLSLVNNADGGATATFTIPLGNNLEPAA